MGFKNYIKIQIYRFETHTYDMDVHKSNLNNEEEACNLQMPYTPKIFRLMTLTTTLALQRMGFIREEALALSIRR